MNYIPFGSTNLEVSRLCLGTMTMGSSRWKGWVLDEPDSIPILHMNDYPDLPREKLSDADRVYPGDGVAPLKELFRNLRTLGFRVNLCLELFNREYWKLDALTVARTGLEKMKAVVDASQG